MTSGPHNATRGTGKTHIAIGLGLAACQKGLSVGFTTAAAMVHELIEARDEKRLAVTSLAMVRRRRTMPSAMAATLQAHCHRGCRGRVRTTSGQRLRACLLTHRPPIKWIAPRRRSRARAKQG